MSVAMLGTAFPMKEAPILMQWPSTSGPSHAFWIGEHWKIATKQIAIAQAATTAWRTKAQMRKFLEGKTRRYINRTEVLIMVMRAT